MTAYIALGVLLLAVAALIVALELLLRPRTTQTTALQHTRPAPPQQPPVQHVTHNTLNVYIQSAHGPDAKRGIVRVGDRPRGMDDAWRFSPVATLTDIAPGLRVVEYTEPDGTRDDDGDW